MSHRRIESIAVPLFTNPNYSETSKLVRWIESSHTLYWYIVHFFGFNGETCHIGGGCVILSQNSFSKELFRFDFKSFFAMPGLETTEEGGSGLVLFQKSAFYAFPQPTFSTLL